MLDILAGMDQKDTYAVGYFGGDGASRAVFFFRCQVKMLCIFASVEQKDSYASVAYGSTLDTCSLVRCDVVWW